MYTLLIGVSVISVDSQEARSDSERQVAMHAFLMLSTKEPAVSGLER